MVTRSGGTFGKHLKFPLACRNFAVDTFNIDARFEASIQMFFDNLSTVSVLRTDRAVVRSLRRRKSTWREAWSAVDEANLETFHQIFDSVVIK